MARCRRILLLLLCLRPWCSYRGRVLCRSVLLPRVWRRGRLILLSLVNASRNDDGLGERIRWRRRRRYGGHGPPPVVAATNPPHVVHADEDEK